MMSSASASSCQLSLIQKLQRFVIRPYIFPLFMLILKRLNSKKEGGLAHEIEGQDLAKHKAGCFTPPLRSTAATWASQGSMPIESGFRRKFSKASISTRSMTFPRWLNVIFPHGRQSFRENIRPVVKFTSQYF